VFKGVNGMQSNVMKELNLKHVQKIEDYIPALNSYCRFLTNSSWDGEDIAQETVLKAIEAYGQKAEFISPALLKRIAYNHWIDIVRKRKKETLESDIAYNEVKYDRTLDDAFDIVQYLVKHFTPKQAVILFLKEAFCYRSSEIADILGTTEMAVKSILHRLRKRIENNGGYGLGLIWEKEEERLLSELFYDALTLQDPTTLIRYIPTVHSLMKEAVAPVPSKTLSPSSGLCMAA
jgi:RNA polymerase sigma-70 factor (ECF subfamily)